MTPTRKQDGEEDPVVGVHVDRRHIAYRPPFHVERFKSGLVIGCDAGGANCVRFDDGAPGHVGSWDSSLMQAACDVLNAVEIAPIMRARIPLRAQSTGDQ